MNLYTVVNTAGMYRRTAAKPSSPMGGQQCHTATTPSSIANLALIACLFDLLYR